MKCSIPKLSCLLLATTLLVTGAGAAGNSALHNAKHQAVRAFQPAGYWPADEGAGEILNDHSGNANHGKLIHVGWTNGLLNFTGAYQWAEIPADQRYQGRSFTIGGWVFIRSKVSGSGWPNRGGFLLIGNEDWLNAAGVQLCVRRFELIDAVSSGRENVFGTRLWDRARFIGMGKPSLALGEWHHLLYAFDGGQTDNPAGGEAVVGIASLYLNGQLLATKQGISNRSVKRNIKIGNDAYWWHQLSDNTGCESLDGSVRDMVWFDRALPAEEAAGLCKLTRPEVQPTVYGQDLVVRDGKVITIADLKIITVGQRRKALDLFCEKDEATLQGLSTALLPVLTTSLGEPVCRLPAAQILLKINTEQARTTLRTALPQLIAVVLSPEKPRTERAEAALVLAFMKQEAASVTPQLVSALTAVLKEEGERLPRIEDLLRNSLIWALCNISPTDAQVRELLGSALGKPALALKNISAAPYAAVRALQASNRHLDALHACTNIAITEDDERFFSYTKPGNRDYSSSVTSKGVTYNVGTGKGWQGGEKVSPEEYVKILGRLAGNYPEARKWRPANYGHLYRVPLYKITADGKQQKIYLGGENFVIDGSDAKMLGWSIFMDDGGYLHLMGGQHNYPNTDNYIPGAWEVFDLPRDQKNPDFPAQMYWVTREPGNIATFEFVGQKSNPRGVPGGYLNYMVFLQDAAKKTYLYGRTDALGWQSWGMFRYDSKPRTWTAIGGDPDLVLVSARAHDPKWEGYLHDQIPHLVAPGSIPFTPTNGPSAVRPLVWAWHPAFYNFCRDDFGARFDQTGRLHLKMAVEGLDAFGYVQFSSVYAYSDDNARTFHRSDGSVVPLPLTINPAPAHDADMKQHNTQQWWDLWTSILDYAGLQKTLRSGSWKR